MNASKIVLSNRTREKAENLKKLFKEIEVIDWGKIAYFDMVVNATSLGLKKNDKFNIDFSNVGKNKLFYDVIYNSVKTEFSDGGNLKGNKLVNGLDMFLFQAQKAFNIWHNIEPVIDGNLIKYLSE